MTNKGPQPAARSDRALKPAWGGVQIGAADIGQVPCLSNGLAMARVWVSEAGIC